MRWRVRLVVAALVLLAVPVALAPYWWKATAVVERAPMADRLIARGAVVAAEGVAEVAGPSDGRVSGVFVRVGDRVEAGGVLAEVEGLAQPSSVVRITAPIAGSVLARRVDVGDSVAALAREGHPALFEIADTSKTEVRAEVEERDSVRLAKGLAATLTTPGGRVVVGRGVVVRVADALNPRTIGAEEGRVRAEAAVRTAWLAWEGPMPVVPLGRPLEVHLIFPEKPATTRVTRAAIAVREGRTVVDARVLLWSREIAVEVGAADAVFAEVRGVEPGTKVFLH